MRQISLRQEAGRIGRIGSCGRELCCSTWLTDFKSVSTSAARYQNLSLNPSKLSGQCGRLKCCLNYELDTYMEALSGIPDVEKPIQTKRGSLTLQKTDIFRKIMWFSYSEDNIWHPVKVERVAEIIALNKQGEKPDTLMEDILEIEEAVQINSDLIKLDRKFSKPKKKKKKGGKFNPNKAKAEKEPNSSVKEKPKGNVKKHKNKKRFNKNKKNPNNNKTD